MVNVTYDASGDLEWSTDTASGVYNLGDIAWTLASTALVWIMIPGVGFFYSGLLRRKNALSMIYLSMMTVAVVSFQWFFWGYSLAFSDTAGKYIGNLIFCSARCFESASVGSPRVPAIVFCVFQLMFAAITPMIAIGAVAERSRLGPLLVFVFVWSTLVYDPIACWTWNPNVFLWFGWFGFNGGSALSANLRATEACIVTNLAASVGGLTWMLWDWRLERKWSVVGFCSGAIAGLVAITPGSGFVGAPAAVLFGFMAGTLCNFATQLKFLFKYDDTLDIFASHAVGGIVGNVLTGLFAQASVAGADGITVIPGGWLDHNYRQLGIQLADSVSGLSYSFVMTTVILWIMHYIPGLCLRCDEETEIVGVDDAEMGEFAYDYVGIESELLPRSEYNTSSGNRVPPQTESTSHESEQEKDPRAVAQA
ncbi:ammonium transporter AmtB-like domain-containing protein [Melanogaster broomeanus]|nr:ammonium transporter AmtB-like domain-containing protein [Melanogaster broomeanus]